MCGTCRRARTIPAEVKELKAQLPKPDAEGNRPKSPLDQQIAELEEVRIPPDLLSVLLYLCKPDGSILRDTG